MQEHHNCFPCIYPCPYSPFPPQQLVVPIIPKLKCVTFLLSVSLRAEDKVFITDHKTPQHFLSSSRTPFFLFLLLSLLPRPSSSLSPLFFLHYHKDGPLSLSSLCMRNCSLNHLLGACAFFFFWFLLKCHPREAIPEHRYKIACTSRHIPHVPDPVLFSL